MTRTDWTKTLAVRHEFIIQRCSTRGLKWASSLTSTRQNVPQPGHNKMILSFEAFRQARAPVARLEPTTEKSLQILG
ncbi:hypothetical protein PoB_002787500 [Plakobranchus ocellatus]|uniref:Uncharacterized protein n=1 Tax=Plakobranchus ocellatus TaxID=259542 RepID=A0AAV4A1S2_9GAST|nr:hypothetical protein PoB_002787500 [Plakobranchus ocellatus]